MPDNAHLERLISGVAAWNEWREKNPLIRPDLTNAVLRGLELRGVNLSEALLEDADLSGSDLSKALLVRTSAIGANLSHTTLREAMLIQSYLQDANLSDSDLSGSHLEGTDLTVAELARANLSRASLVGTNFNSANLSGANLRDANLNLASLVRTILRNATLAGASVFGTSVWEVDLLGADQQDLVITLDPKSVVTVDNLEVAQFIYLLLNNENIRHVIDTITSKVVLILGRFTPERKAILDAIRDELRRRNYLPVLFYFDKPSNRDITETISTLAHMARFVIADITDARSIPQELMAIVPALPSVPVQPLLLASQQEYGMFEHFKRFPWVLEPYLYEDQDGLLAAITDRVIGPAEAKVRELVKL